MDEKKSTPIYDSEPSYIHYNFICCPFYIVIIHSYCDKYKYLIIVISVKSTTQIVSLIINGDLIF